MINVKLVQDAVYRKGEKRLHTNIGEESRYSLTEWFEAAGVDLLGNDYEVVWTITEPEATDIKNMCDWEHPEEVFSLVLNRPISASLIF